MSMTHSTMESPCESAQTVGHDVRHALFAIQTGLDLLPQVRSDPEKFAEVHDLLLKEIALASQLLDPLLAAVRSRSS